MEEEVLYLSLNEAKVGQELEAYKRYLKHGNSLIQALRVCFKDRLCKFTFDQLKEFFSARDTIRVEDFHSYLHSQAAKTNESWIQHSEELGIEITKDSFPVKPFPDHIVDLIKQFANSLNTNNRLGIDKQYVVTLENGDGLLDEEALSNHLKSIHGTALCDKVEIELFRKAEAAAALLEELMGSVYDSLSSDEQPVTPYGHKLKVMPIEMLFDVDFIEGKIRASHKIIPRLKKDHDDLWYASNRELLSESYRRDIDQNPSGDNAWAKLSTQAFRHQNNNESSVKY